MRKGTFPYKLKSFLFNIYYKINVEGFKCMLSRYLLQEVSFL